MYLLGNSTRRRRPTTLMHARQLAGIQPNGAETTGTEITLNSEISMARKRTMRKRSQTVHL